MVDSMVDPWNGGGRKWLVGLGLGIRKAGASYSIRNGHHCSWVGWPFIFAATRKMAHIIRLPMRCKYEASNEVMKRRLLIQTPLASQPGARGGKGYHHHSLQRVVIIGQAVMGSQGESVGNLLTFASPRATMTVRIWNSSSRHPPTGIKLVSKLV